MSDEIVFNEPHSIDAFRQTIMPTFRDGLDIALARYRDGELMGGVVYTEYYAQHCISMHVHSWHRHWLNRDLIYVAFDYPFNQLGVKYIFGSSREDKVAFDLNVGFKIVSRVENFYPDTHKVILRMARDECRFLTLKPRGIRRSIH